MPLTLGNYRLIHSGDVKMYENLDVLPRAFLVEKWQWQPEVTSSVAATSQKALTPSSSGNTTPNPFSQIATAEISVRDAGSKKMRE